MNTYSHQVVVDCVFEYWVNGKTQEMAAEKISREHYIKLHQMQFSQLLRDYGYGAERGQRRGKLRYLKNSGMTDQQIKSWLYQQIFGYQVRSLEELEYAFSSINSEKTSKSHKGNKNNSNGCMGTIILFIIFFLLLNWIFPFWWWIDIIIAFFASTMVYEQINKK